MGVLPRLKIHIQEIQPGMAGFGTEMARRHPWLVFLGDQRERSMAFKTLDQALKYAGECRREMVDE